MPYDGPTVFDDSADNGQPQIAQRRADSPSDQSHREDLVKARCPGFGRLLDRISDQARMCYP